MGGFLGGLFEKKSASGGTQAVSRAVSQSPSRYGLWGSTGPWDVDKAVNDAYEKDMLVYRCIDAIATNQSSIPLLHRKGDPRNGRIMQSPRLMTLLNVRPNIYETAAQMRYRLTAQALLSRKGAFIEIVGDPRNPESLHLLPPQSVEPIPHPTRFVEGYRVRGADQTETTLRPEQVIWVKLKPHPIDPYQQMTPLVAAGISIETDILARLFNRNFLANDGRPGLLVSVRGQVNPEDAAEIKRRFGGGPAMAGQTTIIEADGMDIADMGATPRDAQWTESISASKEDILLAFGVPESVLGNASGRTFDNADAEYEMFWTHTMKPHCEALAACFDVFTGSNTDDEVIAYDYSTVDVLQRQERRRQEAVIDRWMKGAITWDEMRDEIGLEQWDVVASRIVVLPSGIAMAKSPEDQAKIMALPIPGIPPQQGGGPTGALEHAAQQGARLGAREAARKTDNLLAARALALAGKPNITVEQIKSGEGDAAPFGGSRTSDVVDAVLVSPYEAEAKQLEATLDGLLIGMSSRQESVVCDRLMHSKNRKGTRHWEQEEKTQPFRKLDPFYAVEVVRWTRETREDFERVLSPVMKREMRRVIKDMESMGMSGPSADDQRRIMTEVMEQVLSVVETSTRNQSERIARIIKLRDDENASLEDIKREVSKLISTRSTWRKGLTLHASLAAIEAVRHETYASNPRIKKTWNTENDERVRTSHVFADDETIPINEMFIVGSTMMRFPHDPLAPVEEVAGCRCWMTYST